MSHDGIFEKVKSYVNIAEVAERFGVKLDRTGKGLCPFHKEDTPSFSVKKSDNIFKCFGCNESGDAIDFVAKLKGIEPLDAAKLLAETYGITAEQGGTPKKVATQAAGSRTAPTAAPQAAKTEIKKYMTECKAAVCRTDYFKRRGLTDETIAKFHLGYDAQKQAVVIPYSSKFEYYQTRSVADKKFFKPKTEDAGAEPLYNAEAMSNAKSGIVFVVESPICALSIMQCGALALSTCGTGTMKLVAEVKSKKPKCIFILCFDNDDAGKKAQQDLANQLCELNARFLPFNIAGECKDPNDLLMKDAGALAWNIAKAVEAAKDKFKSKYDSFSAAELQEYRLEPPTWLIDGMLCDGVHFLCAPSKFGKSWMVLQLCLAVSQGLPFLGLATKASSCLYLDLEDSPYRLQDRMRKIQGNRAAPKNCYFMLEAKRTDKGLFEQLHSELLKSPDIKLIVIDVFQKVRSKASCKESAYESDYNELDGYKEFVKTHAVTILIVHHLRKMVDEADVFNMISGSVGLMASADNSFIICKKKRDDPTARFVMTGRDVYRDPLDISYDKKTHLWRAVDSPEKEALNREKENYENDPIVKTIKGLMQAQPTGWTGTATQLSMASVDITGYPLSESADSIGKKLKALEVKLYADGICHKVAASRQKGRQHTFFKKGFVYAQRSFMQSGDDDE